MSSRVAQTPALESWWLAAVLMASAVAVPVVTVLTRSHLPHGRWARRGAVTGVSVFSLLLLLAGLAIGLNAYVGYIPTVGALTGEVHTGRSPVGSRLLHLDLAAPALGVGDGSTYVWLPPGYDARQAQRRRYPVVYLYPGAPGSSVDWFRAGQAQQTLDLLVTNRAISPMIVVAPSTNDGRLVDLECANVSGGPQLEDYLTRYVPAVIDRQFRTVANRSGRVLGGISAGADCALDLALHHLGEFGTVLAHLPSGEPGWQARAAAYHGDQAAYAANSPIRFLPRWPRLRQELAVYLDSDTASSSDLQRARQLAAELRRVGASVVLRVAGGFNHTWWEGRAELPYSLSFASAVLGGDLSGRPAKSAALVAAECRAVLVHLPANATTVRGDLARERVWRAQRTAGARRPTPR